MRSLRVLGGLILCAGCAFDPPGLCDNSSQCALGTYCAPEGLCVAGCDSDSRCEAWEECAIGAHLCALRVGRCTVDADCNSPQSCDTEGHRCTSVGLPCNQHEDCVTQEVCTGGLCAFAPNACTTRDECLDYQECVNGGCYSGVDVMMTGFFNRDSFWGGIGAVQDPNLYRLPFGINAPTESMVIPTTGQLAYTGGKNLVLLFVDEKLVWSDQDRRWTWPKSPELNDDVLATGVGCGSLGGMVIRQSTNQVAYICDNGKTYNAQNQEIAGFPARSWNHAGHVLGPGPNAWTFHYAHGTTTSQFSIAGRVLHRVRAHRDSFRMLMATTATPPTFELWSVDSSAAPVMLGTYPPITDRAGTTGLASDDSMLYISQTGVRRAVLGATGVTTVHDNGRAPEGANDPTRAVFIGYLFIYPESSHLITPP